MGTPDRSSQPTEVITSQTAEEAESSRRMSCGRSEALGKGKAPPSHPDSYDPGHLPTGGFDIPVEYRSLSLREVYERSCDSNACRRNTSLMALLPDSPSASATLTSLDLSLNFVGRLGLRPVISVIKCAPMLRHLSVADNFLDNSAISEVLSAIDGLPNLTSLDISRNPVSQSGGKHLNSILRNNASIGEVQLEGTLINPALKAAILRKAAENRALTEEERKVKQQQQNALRRAHKIQQARRQQKCHYHSSQQCEPLDTVIVLARNKDPRGERCPALNTLLECLEV
eukprot:Sspe_Gene.35807::Locus_17339_Transcript_1_1_Confidence_1.000_Length_1122::g.35807::m.35807